MTKLGRLVVSVLAAAALASAQEVSFKLMGGLSLIHGGDYDRGAAGALRLLRDTSTGVAGDFGRFGIGPNVQAEIITHWGRRIAVGLGGGLYEIRAKGSVSSQSAAGGVPVSVETVLTPKISVIPFYVNIYYKTKIGSRMGIDIFGGPLFNVAMFRSHRETTSNSGSLAESETYRASQVALGAQAGAGLSLAVGKGIALVADGAYRYGKVSDFSGNWALSTTTSAGTVTKSSAESFFWIYESGQGTRYPVTGFFDAAGPTGEGISGARKAEINLSGLILSAGLKFSF